MRSRQFYAAKINIHQNIFSPDLDDLIQNKIPEALDNSGTIKIHSWNWTLTDVKRVNHHGQLLVTGDLTKSKQQDQKVRKGKTTTNIKTDEEIAQTAFFVYDIENEILIHEKKSAISTEHFIDAFTKILSKDIHVGDVIINPIPEPYKIRDEILAMDKLTSLKFSLIHPNPGKKEFNLYRNIIDENELKKLDINMENKEGFEVIEKKDDDLVNQQYRKEKVKKTKKTFNKTVEYGIRLIEAGYGYVFVKGYNILTPKGRGKKVKKTEKKSFSSKDSIQKIKVDTKDDDKLISRIASFIINITKK